MRFLIATPSIPMMAKWRRASFWKFVFVLSHRTCSSSSTWYPISNTLSIRYYNRETTTNKQKNYLDWKLHFKAQFYCEIIITCPLVEHADNDTYNEQVKCTMKHTGLPTKIKEITFIDIHEQSNVSPLQNCFLSVCARETVETLISLFQQLSIHV